MVQTDTVRNRSRPEVPPRVVLSKDKGQDKGGLDGEVREKGRDGGVPVGVFQEKNSGTGSGIPGLRGSGRGTGERAGGVELEDGRSGWAIGVPHQIW